MKHEHAHAVQVRYRCTLMAVSKSSKKSSTRVRASKVKEKCTKVLLKPEAMRKHFAKVHNLSGNDLTKAMTACELAREKALNEPVGSLPERKKAAERKPRATRAAAAASASREYNSSSDDDTSESDDSADEWDGEDETELTDFWKIQYVMREGRVSRSGRPIVPTKRE